MNERNAKNEVAKKTRKSKAYSKAKIRAQEYINDSESLKTLVQHAFEKGKRNNGPMQKVMGSLGICLRLTKAYATGTYREIPWSSLVMIVTALIYFVMPIDFIPDFILGLGLLDDTALLVWTIKTVGSDIEAFLEWESRTTT